MWRPGFKLLPIALGLSVLLLGCSAHTDESPAAQKADKAAALAKALKSIDENTHMPEEAKAAAKQSLLAHQNVDMSIRR
ncbi:MAG TPA: hypothetical protein VFA07_11590 [Chthonomonadaceae bacterium]|nr:hypothetical protein [Chthonomonadaceae bacterium]